MSYNKEKKSEYAKEWYINNREKHREYCAGKITCACGATIRRSSITVHHKTKKHRDYEQHLQVQYVTLQDKYDKLEKQFKERHPNEIIDLPLNTVPVAYPEGTVRKKISIVKTLPKQDIEMIEDSDDDLIAELDKIVPKKYISK